MEAMNKSIEKWENIIMSRGLDERSGNCDLCKKYNEVYACISCPVAKYTGESQCEKTPYEEWLKHHIEQHENKGTLKVECTECARIALDMVNFLKEVKKSIKVNKVDHIISDKMFIDGEINCWLIARNMYFDRALKVLAPINPKLTVEQFKDNLAGRINKWIYEWNEDEKLEIQLREQFGDNVIDRLYEKGIVNVKERE